MVLLEMEPPLKINLVCSTEMFRINIKAVSATLSLGFFNSRTNNLG